MRTAISPPCLASFLPLVGFCRLAACRPGRLCRRLAGERAEIRHLALAHPLHQLLHLFARIHEPVDLLDGCARAVGDSKAPRSVDDLRQGALLRSHREDDRLDAAELLLVDLVEALHLLERPEISFSRPWIDPMRRS